MGKKLRALNNFIRSKTAGDMPKYANFSAAVDGALHGSGFTDLYDEYHPQHVGFMNAYDVRRIQKGQQKKNTEALQRLLKGLTPALAQWDYDIQGVYKKDSLDYLGIFPNGRTPFHNGKQVNRVAAVRELSRNLTGIATLATVKTSVDAYYADLNAAFDTQQTSRSTTNVKRTLLEQQWENACESAYFVYAGLLQQFNNNTERVADYIPFQLLDTTPQKVFTAKLPANAIKVLAKRTAAPDTLVTMKNPGLVAYEGYVSATKDGALPIGATPVVVQPGLTVTVPVTELGSLSNKYFIVRNLSTVAEADVEVSL